MPVLSKKQQADWIKGACMDAHLKLGAHPQESGAQFGVWAPSARKVHIVGDFNDWDPEANSMKKDPGTGIWEAVVQNARPNDCYKYSITAPDGDTVLKADPYAFCHQVESHRASVIYPLPDYNWQDESWLTQRSNLHQPNRPLSIYEVHLGSWKRKTSGERLSYKALAKELIPHVKQMGFTHIELMPVMEHPYEPSWGYQVTGYFAPTARYGSPEDFMFFIDECHINEIGVILDWVPGHFPRDEHGLAFFDGTPLYEHEDKHRREHADWGTHNFDFDKPGVRNFLLSNAFFWCDKYHIDGFRVDAVASMLYLDYSKSKDHWLPNVYGGKENLSALAFLQDLNQTFKERYPSVLIIAEESTTWPGVTKEVAEGGLGFDYKWNMGWMNDTLYYFEQNPKKRIAENHSITFPSTFAFDEQFILPFSHDEVVHLKKSLWSKMPGTNQQRFWQLKLLYLFQIGYPGKKLLFMGSELAEPGEWSEGSGLNWSLLEREDHKNIHDFLSELLHFYKSEPALYGTDHTKTGFRWVDLSNQEKGIFAFSRSDEEADQEFIFAFNFSEKVICDYGLNPIIPGNEYKLLYDSLEQDDLECNPSKFTLQAFQGLVFSKKG